MQLSPLPRSITCFCLPKVKLSNPLNNLSFSAIWTEDFFFWLCVQCSFCHKRFTGLSFLRQLLRLFSINWYHQYLFTVYLPARIDLFFYCTYRLCYWDISLAFILELIVCLVALSLWYLVCVLTLTFIHMLNTCSLDPALLPQVIVLGSEDLLKDMYQYLGQWN